MMKRMLLIGCLITILAFSAFGCSGGSKDAHASETETVEYKPISIRMFDVYAATEDGKIFYRPHNTKAWVTDEDEQAFVNGDKLRYGGRYGMDGMIGAPIIICQPVNYWHSIKALDEEDYGVSSDKLMPEPVEPPPYDGPRPPNVDVRLYSSDGRLMWFFNDVYMTDNDLEIHKAGGNLRFQKLFSGRDWVPQGVYLVKAPIVTITEDIIIGPMPWEIVVLDDDARDMEPQGDPLD